LLITKALKEEALVLNKPGSLISL